MAACPSKSCLYLSKEKFREIPITFSHFTKWFLFLVFLLLLICIKLQLYLESSSIMILIQMALHKILFIVIGFFFHIWRRYHVTMSQAWWDAQISCSFHFIMERKCSCLSHFKSNPMIADFYYCNAWGTYHHHFEVFATVSK